MVISTEVIHSVIIPLLIAFAISVVLSPFVIPFLRKLKIGQTERVEGVKSHLQKSGTPTMGGTIILISILVTCLFFVGRYPRIVPVLFLTLGFGIIGFLDDYLKVVLKRSDGLLPGQKMACQIIITTIFVVYMVLKDESGLSMVLPFTDYVFDAKWVTIPLAYMAIIGTDNGVNFTDGLDGLASSVTAVVAVFFTLASMACGGGIEPITASVAGALLGFLLFNVHPAQVFMGDTGSLALGGFVAGAAYMLRIPWIILVVGLIYLVEVLSVMIQVAYFKKTGGKRFFKMAPIHHHFELCGWSETRIVSVFSTITMLLCLLGLLLIR